MPHQPRSEETHAAIRGAALATFAAAGYEATSVDAICQAAGVSKGAFYYHFPTKQALFLELLEEWLHGIDERLGEARSGPGNTAETLMHMAGMVRGVFEVANDLAPMFLEFWTQARRDPAVWSATIAPYRRYQSYFQGLLQEGMEDGSLRPIDSAVGARTIVALTIGLLLQGLLDPGGAEWASAAQDCLRLLLEGLGRKQP
jgi:AcrR family transcriptional regulator